MSRSSSKALARGLSHYRNVPFLKAAEMKTTTADKENSKAFCESSGMIRRKVSLEEGADLLMSTLQTREIGSAIEYEKIINDERPVVIWFYSTWSRPCQQMAPFWETVAYRARQHVRFYRVNLDMQLFLDRTITHSPTVLFFKTCKEAS